MKTIKYISFYNHLPQRSVSPAATAKMEYLIYLLEQLGYQVEIISLSSTLKDFSPKQVVSSPTHPHTMIHYFTSLAKHNRLQRWISGIYLRVQFIMYILLNVRRQETILVYHSLAYCNMIVWLKRIKGFKLLLEFEEIYANVTNQPDVRKQELALAHQADGFSLATQLLNPVVNRGNKPAITIHGTYLAEPKRNPNPFNDGKTHVVYAGTLDPRKGGGLAAATAARYLPQKYHVHILGFGSKQQIADMEQLVSSYHAIDTAGLSYEGCLSGEEFICFLQRCHIGLSTQNPKAAFNDTSFPSKVLTYMANDLKVVSIRIPAIEQSSLAPLITFYDQNTPQAIAHAILQATELTTHPAMYLQTLNTKTQQQLNLLLQQL